MKEVEEQGCCVRLPDGTALARTPRGCVVWRLASGVLFLASRGRVELALAEVLVEGLEAARALGGPMKIACYAPESESLDSDARRLLVAWSRAHGSEVRCVILVRSKVVRMAATAIALLARSDLTLFVDEAQYSSAVTAFLPPEGYDPHLERLLAPPDTL